MKEFTGKGSREVPKSPPPWRGCELEEGKVPSGLERLEQDREQGVARRKQWTGKGGSKALKEPAAL